VNPRTLTRALGALAVAAAVVLAIVLLLRPGPGTRTAAAPATSPSQTHPVTSTPISAPTPTAAEVSDPAAEGGPSPLPSSEVQAHDASPGATPYSQTEQARRQWEPVATGFGRAFTNTRGRNTAIWRGSLTPYVTDAVADQLATVDLRNVPAGRFAGVEPAEFGEDKVAVFIHYDSDFTLVTYLILDDTSWRIYAYDRWAE
jgi:hypothetical protein